MRTASAIAPRADFVQVEHAGHAPFLTHADAVATALLGFLARHAAADGMPGPGCGTGAEGQRATGARA